MKRFLYFLLLITCNIYSQDIIENHEIEWSDRYAETENKEELKTLYFKGVDYTFQNGRVFPYVIVRIEIDENVDIRKISLTENNYLPVSTKENKIIKGWNVNLDEIEFKNNIVKSRESSFAIISFIPIKKVQNKYQKISNFTINIWLEKSFQSKTLKLKNKSNSILNSGN